MPLVVMLTLALVQLAVIVSDVLTVQLAAREAARAAAVANAAVGAGSAAGQRALHGDGTISVRAGPATVSATAARVNHTDVPLIGALLPDVVIEATVSMAVEPP